MRDRLLHLAKGRGEAFDLVLTRYALERFLYRLAKSPYRQDLVLKGAMLFQAWGDVPHRATRDLDLLARGGNGPAWIEERIRAVCAIEVDDDGLAFDLQELAIRAIREESRYGGTRARFLGRLGTARIPVQIDFGVGDVITPAPIETEYPTLLGTERPTLLAYPRETVVAEKLEAIVELGMDNSRMKDYFDLWFIATTYEHDTDALRTAVRRTFERRKQVLPEGLPVGLSDRFANDASKQAQWQAFQRRIAVTTPPLSEVVAMIRDFARPLFEAA